MHNCFESAAAHTEEESSFAMLLQAASNLGEDDEKQVCRHVATALSVEIDLNTLNQLSRAMWVPPPPPMPPPPPQEELLCGQPVQPLEPLEPVDSPIAQNRKAQKLIADLRHRLLHRLAGSIRKGCLASKVRTTKKRERETKDTKE